MLGIRFLICLPSLRLCKLRLGIRKTSSGSLGNHIANSSLIGKVGNIRRLRTVSGSHLRRSGRKVLLSVYQIRIQTGSLITCHLSGRRIVGIFTIPLVYIPLVLLFGKIQIPFTIFLIFLFLGGYLFVYLIIFLQTTYKGRCGTNSRTNPISFFIR